MSSVKTKVCVIDTDPGYPPLILRSSPTLAEIKAFVDAHNEKAQNGYPEGPGMTGQPARVVQSATIYPSEESWLAGDEGKIVNIPTAPIT